MLKNFKNSLRFVFCYLLVSVNTVFADYAQIHWGHDKTVNPYNFDANINGTWHNMSTISSAGVWTIPSSNVANLNFMTGLSASGDNGAIIQAAVNACPSTGCALVIPYGSYPVATSITLKTGVVIQGQGSSPGYSSNTRLYNNGLTGPMFIFPGSSSVSPGISAGIGLRNFTIDMHSADYAAILAPELGTGRGTWNGQITHMSIVNARPALDIVNGWDWWINDSAFVSCGNAASGTGHQKACLYISNSVNSYAGAASNSIHIANNFIDTSVGEGIDVDSSLGSTTKVTFLFITGNHFGIKGYENISGCMSNSVVSDNISEGTFEGHAIFNLSGKGTGCAFNVITNNSFNSPGAHSIVDANTSDLIANNFNYIKGTNTAWYSLTAASGNITVTGNKSDDNPCCNTIPMVTDSGSLNTVQWNDGSEGVVSFGRVPVKISGASRYILTDSATNFNGLLISGSSGTLTVANGSTLLTSGAYTFGLYGDATRGLQFRPANGSASTYTFAWADGTGTDKWGMDSSYNLLPATDNSKNIGSSSASMAGVYAYIVLPKPVAIASLTTCSATINGAIAVVKNGTAYKTGTYGSAISATGAVTRKVLCTNTGGPSTYAWVYD